MVIPWNNHNVFTEGEVGSRISSKGFLYNCRQWQTVPHQALQSGGDYFRRLNYSLKQRMMLNLLTGKVGLV
jgi:hypothetical protein